MTSQPASAWAQMVRSVARAVASADRAEEALEAALASVCDLASWPLGRVLLVESGALKPTKQWHLDPAGPFARARDELENALPAEAGITGAEALRERRPIWAPLPDTRWGLRTTCAVPVVADAEVAWILELYSDEDRAPEAELIGALGEAAALLGLRAERDRARRRAGFIEDIAHHVAHPIFVKDRQFRFVFLNRALCRMVGIPAETMIGRTDYDFFPREQADHFRAKDEEMFASGNELVIEEEPITDALGNRHVLSTTKVPLFDASGEATHLVGIIHDITALKNAEARARQLAGEQAARLAAEEGRHRMALLAGVSQVLAGSLQQDETLEKIARCAVPDFADGCRAVRVDPDAGEDPVSRTHSAGGDAPRAEVALEEGGGALEAEVLQTGQARLLPAAPPDDGSSLPDGDSWICVPLLARGRVLGAMTFLRVAPRDRFRADDLQLARQLADRAGLALDTARLYGAAQQAIGARDEFLSIAAHELRTPLTSLKIHVGKLLRAAPDSALGPDRFVSTAEAMRRQVDRLTILVNNLLDVARLTAGRFALDLQEVDLRELMREVIEHFAPELERAKSPATLHAPAPAIGRWDPLRLEQVVTNLLANAVKYGAGKPIEVSVEVLPTAVRLSVRDHGIGIQEDEIHRIFERFHRAAPAHEYGGLGLGLYISRQIVTAHGGQMRVESSPGEGACFIVEVPIAAG